MTYGVPALQAASKVTTGTVRSLRLGDSGGPEEFTKLTYAKDEAQGT